MNLDSIHRFIAEAQSFQMQQSSLKSACDTLVPASPPGETCHSSLPLHGFGSQTTQNACAHSHSTSEWDLSKELRLRELEEVKARAAQMEKTMRWWSDCTANWREKWSKVRAERNSAREEGRQLRLKLEMTTKELSALKKKQRCLQDREASEVQVSQDLKRSAFSEDQCLADPQTRECLVKTQTFAKENANRKEEDEIIDPLRLNKNRKLHLDSSDSFSQESPGGSAMKVELSLHSMDSCLEDKGPQVSAVRVPSDDVSTILRKEREIRFSLEREIEQLESALSLWKWKYEELRAAKTNDASEINSFHRHHENEMEGISRDIKERSKSQSNMNREIYELRSELERLKAENTLEWDKREILETEKQVLERENRRLKAQVQALEELLDRRNKLSALSQGPDFKTSQMELEGKHKNPASGLLLLRKRMSLRAAPAALLSEAISLSEAQTT
ncbi:PREDICTED: coiled-coil domain-containing protein 102B [Elephantulus edwardii]|uniref:coiled-coil domain-containing protein 102B n=1 Tax=Elephantulus edwardii TaxID=28737 RepID=UPI0003F0BBBF|nr:PREDICTED: coiled-coil domain-containing protein 102B [Elephantulus edwardii]